MNLLYWQDPEHPEYGSDEMDYREPPQHTYPEDEQIEEDYELSPEAEAIINEASERAFNEMRAMSEQKLIKYIHVIHQIKEALRIAHHDLMSAYQVEAKMRADYDSQGLTTLVTGVASYAGAFLFPPLAIGFAASFARGVTLKRDNNDAQIQKHKGTIKNLETQIETIGNLCSAEFFWHKETENAWTNAENSFDDLATYYNQIEAQIKYQESLRYHKSTQSMVARSAIQVAARTV